MSQTGSRLLDAPRPSLPSAVEVILGLSKPGPDSDADPVPSEQAARRPRAASVVTEIALTLGALLGVAVMGVTVVAAHTGIQPLVVRSGSMEPTIHTGSMVLVKRIDASEIKVGDIVAVERPDHTRVTHRVLALQPKGGTVELTLKGDANEDPDPVPVTVRQAERLIWQAPVIGRTVAWLATAPGGFAMGCLVTAVAMHVLGRRSASGSRRRGVRLRTRPALAGHAD
jgi:signal peptidase